jgi:hypothetical protein
VIHLHGPPNHAAFENVASGGVGDFLLGPPGREADGSSWPKAAVIGIHPGWQLSGDKLPNPSISNAIAGRGDCGQNDPSSASALASRLSCWWNSHRSRLSSTIVICQVDISLAGLTATLICLLTAT